MTQKESFFELKQKLLLIFSGIASGCAFTLNILSAVYHHALSVEKLAGWLAAGSILFILLFFTTRKIILKLVAYSSLADEVKSKF